MEQETAVLYVLQCKKMDQGTRLTFRTCAPNYFSLVPPALKLRPHHVQHHTFTGFILLKEEKVFYTILTGK